MAIRTRNKRDISFNFSSMSDLVFLLLIFFVLTSTLIAPNAIKLLLPKSDGITRAKQTVTVYINSENEYFLDGRTTAPISLGELEMNLTSVLSGHDDASVVVRADQTVDVQYVVTVIDMVKGINDDLGTTHKVVLATRPK